MPPIRVVLVVAAAATIALATPGSAQMTGPRVTHESMYSMLDFAMREHGVNATVTTPIALTDEGLWLTLGWVIEQAGSADRVILKWDSQHVVAPHEEDPNPNHYIGMFDIDGFVEKTTALWHDGDRRSCRILEHEDHWDVWIATSTFTVDRTGNILFWSWMLDGRHIYRLPSECFLGGRLGDGVTPGRGGCVSAAVDTEANVVTVNAVVAGAPLATVLQASLRAGPNGPDMVTIPAGAITEQDGALIIAARDVWFDHAVVQAMAAGQAYLEIATTQGPVGGFVLPIAPQVTGIAPVEPPAGLTLRISPNPAVRTIQIHYRAPDSATPVALVVHDVTGRRVRAVTLPANADGTYTVDLQDDDGARLAAGLYFATLRVGDRRVTQRFAVVD